MYDNILNDIARERHQDLINEAAKRALVRELRRQQRRPSRRLNVLPVALTNLLTH